MSLQIGMFNTTPLRLIYMTTVQPDGCAWTHFFVKYNHNYKKKLIKHKKDLIRIPLKPARTLPYKALLLNSPLSESQNTSSYIQEMFGCK